MEVADCSSIGCSPDVRPGYVTVAIWSRRLLVLIKLLKHTQLQDARATVAHPEPDALLVSGTDEQADIGLDEAFLILLNQNAPLRIVCGPRLSRKKVRPSLQLGVVQDGVHERDIDV